LNYQNDLHTQILIFFNFPQKKTEKL